MKKMLLALGLSVALAIPMARAEASDADINAAIAAFSQTIDTAARIGSVSKLGDEMLSPVVQINRNCSASIIKSAKDETTGKVTTTLLTAKHCIKEKTVTHEVYVPVYKNNRLIREELYRASFKTQTAAHDLALLELLDDETVFENVVKIAPSNVELYEGEDVWAVGWSLALKRVITKGTFGNREVMEFPDKGREIEYFRATPQIAGGNSGGALFHMALDGSYELIGVTSAGYPAHDFVGMYVPVDVIAEFVAQKVR